MPRPRKEPEYLECRWCGAELPHGQVNPKTGRRYRTDMQFCPWGPAEEVVPHSEDEDDLRRENRRMLGRQDKHDRDPASRLTTGIVKPLSRKGSARSSCQDEWHNAHDPSRRPQLMLGAHPKLEAKLDNDIRRPGDGQSAITERNEGLMARIAGLLRRGRESDRQYARTLAIQTGEEDFIKVAVAAGIGAAERDRDMDEQVEYLELGELIEHAARMEYARLGIDLMYTFPTQAVLDAGVTDPRPAPTGAICPNCQQPDTDHLPGCTVASGEDVDAVTDGKLAPAARGTSGVSK